MTETPTPVTGATLTAAMRRHLTAHPELDRVAATFVPYQPGPFMDAAEIHVRALYRGRRCRCRIDLGDHLGRHEDDVLAPGPHFFVVFAATGGLETAIGPRLLMHTAPDGVTFARLSAACDTGTFPPRTEDCS